MAIGKKIKGLIFSHMVAEEAEAEVAAVEGG
jgi:hypothetical protein